MSHTCGISADSNSVWGHCTSGRRLQTCQKRTGSRNSNIKITFFLRTQLPCLLLLLRHSEVVCLVDQHISSSILAETFFCRFHNDSASKLVPVLNHLNCIHTDSPYVYIYVSKQHIIIILIIII
jgi:hypothetical protein